MSITLNTKNYRTMFSGFEITRYSSFVLTTNTRGSVTELVNCQYSIIILNRTSYMRPHGCSRDAFITWLLTLISAHSLWHWSQHTHYDNNLSTLWHWSQHLWQWSQHTDTGLSTLTMNQYNDLGTLTMTMISAHWSQHIHSDNHLCTCTRFVIC